MVTGATSGIGKDCVIAWVKMGAKVAFNGRRADRGQELERELKAAGFADVLFVVGSVTM